jgi:PmbA protein
MRGESMRESELLTRSECAAILERAQAAARSFGVQDIEVTLGASDSALTRFANNAIHQNVAERHRSISVRALIGNRTARASTNRCDDAAIERVVEQAIAITRASEPDPGVLPLAEQGDLVDLDRFCPSTAQSGPDDRARTVAGAIEIVEQAGQTAAGIYSTGQSVEAVLNSRGLFAYYFDTLAQFSITAMAADSSGWAKAGTPDCDEVDALQLARRASGKAALSAAPRLLDPGRYTVVLEPAAVQDLLGQMFSDFSATALRDQRSFLTGRLGQQLFGTGINIADDVCHALQTGAPFDGEGVPRRRLALVEDGIPREVARSRSAAARDGVESTGHGFALPNEYGEAPVNIVMEGGNRTLQEIVSSTGRGILVTRLWYIREVDPFQKIMTGMTRDGTFLIEDGNLVSGVRNFRFNQSLLELLNNVEEATPSERASGEESFDMVVPGLRVRDFRFSEVTRF